MTDPIITLIKDDKEKEITKNVDINNPSPKPLETKTQDADILLHVMDGDGLGRAFFYVINDTTEQNTLLSPRLSHPNFIEMSAYAVIGSTMYVCGGLNKSLDKSDSDCYSLSNEVHCFELDHPEKGWRRACSMLEGRADHYAFVCNKKIYVFGGVRNDDSEPPYGEVYNPTLNEWDPIDISLHQYPGRAQANSMAAYNPSNPDNPFTMVKGLENATQYLPRTLHGFGYGNPPWFMVALGNHKLALVWSLRSLADTESGHKYELKVYCSKFLMIKETNAEGEDGFRAQFLSHSMYRVPGRSFMRCLPVGLEGDTVDITKSDEFDYVAGKNRGLAGDTIEITKAVKDSDHVWQEHGQDWQEHHNKQ